MISKGGKRRFTAEYSLIQFFARARGGGVIPVAQLRTAFVIQPINANPALPCRNLGFSS